MEALIARSHSAWCESRTLSDAWNRQQNLERVEHIMRWSSVDLPNHAACSTSERSAALRPAPDGALASMALL